MTHRTELLSPEGAFRRSIEALRGNGWQRLADEYRVSIKTLYNAGNPDPSGSRTPIRQEWVEWLDNTNELEGSGGPINREAWQARHDAALAGVPLPPTTPEVRYTRAILEIKAANADLQRGNNGADGTMHEMLLTLGELVNHGLRLWSEHERERAQLHNRRASDRVTPSKPEHDNRQRSRQREQRKHDPAERSKLRAVEGE